MKNYYIPVFSLLSVFFLLTGCSLLSSVKQPTITPLEIVSLKEHYDDLQERAFIWDEGAYLSEVGIPILGNLEENSLWLISAHFKSPEKTKESIIVYLNPDFSYSVHHEDYSESVLQTKPLIINDVLIDSANVLEYFYDSNLFSEFTDGELATLYLECVRSEPDKPIVWRLSINMGSFNSTHIYIDAYSGEELKISR